MVRRLELLIIYIKHVSCLMIIKVIFGLKVYFRFQSLQLGVFLHTHGEVIMCCVIFSCVYGCEVTNYLLFGKVDYYEVYSYWSFYRIVECIMFFTHTTSLSNVFIQGGEQGLDSYRVAYIVFIRKDVVLNMEATYSW